MRSIGSRALGLPVVLLVTLTLACARQDPAAESAASKEARDSARAATRAAAEEAQRDAVLAKWLPWHREWMLVVNRHKRELDDFMLAMGPKLYLVDADSIARDPEYLALTARQKAVMQALTDRAPGGPIVDAIVTILPGIGVTTVVDSLVAFVPRRDEAVLARARATYGDLIVQWMLDREDQIVATLTGKP